MSSLVLWTCIAFCFVGSGPSVLEGARTPEAFLASQGLPLGPGMREEVRRRLDARWHAARVWGGAGWALGVLAALVAHRAGADAAVPLLIVAPTILASGIGAVIGITRSAAPLDPDSPRVARARAVDWRDYCAPGQRLAAVLAAAGVVLCCASAAVLWLLAPLRPDGGAAPLVVLVLIGMAAVVLEAALVRAAAALADRPQHAADRLTLAWDDALRARAVRDLLALAVGASMMVEAVIIGTACTWLIAPEVRAQGMTLTLILGGGAGAVGALCWVAVVVAWSRERRRGGAVSASGAAHRRGAPSC